MAQTQTRTSNLPPNPEFVLAVQAAHDRTTLIKGTVRIKQMKAAGNNDARDLVASFVDSIASAGQERRVYRSVTCTLWGSDAQTKGDYLASFGKYDEQKGDHQLECLFAFDTSELTRRTYTGQDGGEKEVHQVRWMAIYLDLANTLVVGEKQEPEDI